MRVEIKGGSKVEHPCLDCKGTSIQPKAILEELSLLLSVKVGNTLSYVQSSLEGRIATPLGTRPSVERIVDQSPSIGFENYKTSYKRND